MYKFESLRIAEKPQLVFDWFGNRCIEISIETKEDETDFDKILDTDQLLELKYDRNLSIIFNYYYIYKDVMDQARPINRFINYLRHEHGIKNDIRLYTCGDYIPYTMLNKLVKEYYVIITGEYIKQLPKYFSRYANKRNSKVIVSCELYELPGLVDEIRKQYKGEIYYRDEYPFNVDDILIENKLSKCFG